MKRGLLFAGLAAFSSAYAAPIGYESEDTSKGRKERKDRARVLTMIHEEEMKGKPPNRRLPRSRRKGLKKSEKVS